MLVYLFVSESFLVRVCVFVHVHEFWCVLTHSHLSGCVCVRICLRARVWVCVSVCDGVYLRLYGHGRACVRLHTRTFVTVAYTRE